MSITASPKPGDPSEHTGTSTYSTGLRLLTSINRKDGISMVVALRSAQRRARMTLLAGVVVALAGLGVAASPALAAGSTVYGEGTYGVHTGPKYGWVDVVRTQSEGRTGNWCMNSYLGNGETDPGLGTHCQGVGKDTQYFEGEYPPNQATAQTWNNTGSSGWLWGWVEWG